MSIAFPGGLTLSSPAKTSFAFCATVDGTDLHWTERGAGPALLVLHGLSDSQHTWAKVASTLAHKHRVFCLDLPGCGLSGRPNADYSLEWQAQLVSRWLDRVGIKSFDVLGHSYGGGVALWLLLYRARAMGKLALVAPGGLGNEVTLGLRMASLLGAFESSGDWLFGPITRLFVDHCGPSLSTDDRELLCRLNGSAGAARAFSRTVRDVVSWRGQTRQLLARIDEIDPLPSFGLFWGEQDWVVPIQHGEALCRALRDCRLWRLRRGGHFLHWQHPEWLAAAVSDYLQAPLVRCARTAAVRKAAAAAA